jgi:cytochrome c peroxidase
LKVHGVNAWDAIKAYIEFGVRPPISPVKATNPDVRLGRRLFQRANCQACHGGPQWTSSELTFTPPPSPDLISNGEILDQLRQVGTFDPNAFNEVRSNATPSIGADGFVPPSLLSIFAFPQTFFHNGSAASLEEVLRNVTHRTAGTGGVDFLSREEDRDRLIKFLLSIDANTHPIDES